MPERWLFLDDDPYRHDTFRLRYDVADPDPDITYVYTAEDAWTQLRTGRRFDRVYLDHDLGCAPDGSYRRDGTDLARWMAAELPDDRMPGYVTIHSHNRDGALRMASVLLCERDVTALWVPFTA